MKYIKYLILLLLFIPFIVLAKDDVEIKSITLLEKSEDVTEIENAKYEGLKINFSLRFKNKDDYAKYKVILKNNSDKDYEIDNQTTFNEGNFVKYEYLVDNDIKVLKNNEEITMYIVITYYKEVGANRFVNGVYSENNNASIELSNMVIDEGEKNVISFVTNPETSSNEMIILLVVSTIMCALIILIIKNTKIKMYMLIFVLLLTPILTYALEKLKIEVESYVEIDKNDVMLVKGFYCEGTNRVSINWELNYLDGMTFIDFINTDMIEQLSDDEKVKFDRYIYSSNDSNMKKLLEYEDSEKCEDIEDAEMYTRCVNNNAIKGNIVNHQIVSKRKAYYYFFDDSGCMK